MWTRVLIKEPSVARRIEWVFGVILIVILGSLAGGTAWATPGGAVPIVSSLCLGVLLAVPGLILAFGVMGPCGLVVRTLLGVSAAWIVCLVIVCASLFLVPVS